MRLNQNLLVLGSVLLVGCASSGNRELKQSVTFTANVDHAMVEIDGVRLGRTPIRVELDRTRNHELIVGKSGYEVYQTVLRPTLHSGDYGFDESIKVALTVATNAPNDVPEEDMPEFNRAKSLAEAPFGVDAAIYGTLSGDLAEAKQAAERLSLMAAAARKDAEKTSQNLTKAIAAAKEQAAKGEAQADAQLASSEQALRNALAEAQDAAQQLEKAQHVANERVAFLESLKQKGETAPKQAVEEMAAAKLDTQAAEQKVAQTQKAVTEATAALNAATEARAKAGQGADRARLDALTKNADYSHKSAEELAAKLELASRIVAARVEELSKEIAEGKSQDTTAAAALENARKENAELAVLLAAARNASAKDAAAEAEKALAEANEKAAELERKLADSRLAAETKDRENRARTYAEYTARKGLLERRLRTGELNAETYRAELAALDKELRNR